MSLNKLTLLDISISAVPVNFFLMKITKRSNQQNTKSKFKSAIATLLSDTVSVEKQKLIDLIQIPKSTTHGQFTLPIPQLLKLVPHQDKDVLCKEIVHLVRFHFV